MMYVCDLHRHLYDVDKTLADNPAFLYWLPENTEVYKDIETYSSFNDNTATGECIFLEISLLLHALSHRHVNTWTAFGETVVGTRGDKSILAKTKSVITLTSLPPIYKLISN